MNVNYESLKKTHGEDAAKVFKQVAEIGGFGDVPVTNPGGLDISGLPEATQKSIQKVLDKPEGKKEGK